VRRKLFLIISVVVILSASIFGWRYYIWKKNQPDYSKNIVLIVVDALRADHVSTYGYSRKTTPAIDKFASTGSVFEHAFCPLPTTQPSFSSLFTSLYPYSHGIQRHGVALSHTAITFPELLKAKGWDTAAVVGASNLDTVFGFSQGFDFYEDHLGSKENADVKKLDWRVRWQRNAKEVNQVVFKWLDHRKTKRPFFLMIHYYDPHHPYEAPAPYYRMYPAGDTEVSKWKASYDGEVTYVDRMFGKLLKKFDKHGLLKNTFFVLTADHGENLGEHNWQGHSQRIHDEAVHVPLIFAGPKIPSGKTFPQLVMNIDLAPTILEYLNLPIPPSFQGRSVIPAFEGKSLRDFVYLEIAKRPDNFQLLTADWHKYPETQWGIRTLNEKLIWSSDGNHEFYDLNHDPLELKNLYTERRERAAELEKIGTEFRTGLHKYGYNSGPQRKANDNDPDEALKALGYIN
jgi:arylsulfatase A-like enzyme